VGDSPLHVIFGTGQVGLTLAARLAGSGIAVRTVSRRRPARLAAGIDWRSADATDPEAAADAAKGATEHAKALLVTLENVYGYGPIGGAPMTEDLPLAATTSKGRTRAAMTAELLAAAGAGRVRIAIARASDFFGPGVTETTLGQRVFGNAVAGKRADFIGNPDLGHTYSYVPDIAAGLVTLGTVLDLVAAEVGHPVDVRDVPKLALRALGLVKPLMRELAEMSYEFEQPFVLDTSKYTSMFGAAGTPLGTAIGETVGWYKTQASAK
jgi:nucleoside-diphosphate-sugar epimerase